MRYKLFLVFLFVLALIFPLSTAGQTKTATPSIMLTDIDKDSNQAIEDFKQKVASKVAELHKKEAKVYVGFVKKKSGLLLTITNGIYEEYFVKIDDILTKIYRITGNRKKELDQSDIAIDDYIIVTGPILDKTVTANYIYVDQKYVLGTGKIIAVNKDKYSIEITTAEKENLILDIETTTNQQILNIKQLILKRSGFSKIKEGDTVQFVYQKNNSNPKTNQFSAQKILIIPQEFFIK